MRTMADLVEAAYDDIAAGYDQRWSVHTRAPQQRLTRSMSLSKGMRCVDLGCGTGVDTLEMAQLTAPAEVCAVDCSSNMLAQARERALAEGFPLHTVCMTAEAFVKQAERASFDAASVRFCLAYLPWRDFIAGLAQLLAPGGRLGILTNLGTSTPQALAVYHEMVAKLGVPRVELPVPRSLSELQQVLERSGFRNEDCWTASFRLWFETGEQLASWLEESGFVTHPLLRVAPPPVRRAAWSAFASRIERYREPQGLPLDFELAGVVASRHSDR